MRVFLLRSEEMTGRIILIGSLIRGVLCGFSITQPKHLEVLSGSCAFIPCAFDIDPKYNNVLTADARRLWYKDGITDKKVFDSRSPSTGVLNGTIFGNARNKNCTTRFHYVTQKDTGKYYLRLVGNNNLRLSYAKLQLIVSDFPPKPKVSIEQHQQEVVEGTTVILRCSAKMFCSSHPPALKWSTSSIVSIIEQQRQIQSDLISDLDFNVTHQHHRVNLTCMISYQLQNRNTSARESITLNVQYAPKNTSVFVYPSGCVLEGRSVSLTCSSDGNPAVINFTWYRDTEGHLKHLQTGPNLIFNKTEPKHSGRYYCTAHNKHGNQNSTTLMLDVQYGPKNTSVFVSPSGSVLEGRSVSLTCRSDGNPAVINFTWYRDTEGHLKHLQTGPNLIFNKTEPKHSGRYYCTAHNKHGNQTSDTIVLNITYAPKISQSSCIRSDIIACFCEVDGNPVPTLEWRLSGRPIVNSTSTSIFQEQLGDTNFRTTLTVNQPLTDTPTLQCVSGNSYGSVRQEFQELQPPKSLDVLSLLAGLVIGVIVMLIVGIVSLFCMRQNCKPSQTKHGDSSGLVMNAAVLDNGDAFGSSTEAVTHHTSESLHYSSIYFTNTEAASRGKRNISLITDNSEVQHHAADATETKNTSADSKINQSTPDTMIKSTEDTIYENIIHSRLIN
ncbi:sialoadhesin isoform X2 [Triplophysa dalaica]|uniref:sialoadhesin isoform X2 n=1 Tax=Triplophysa dalaica TaxID=1582913 RepID=UPI0024DFE820|nr:sialoadhesin isoform X2 [Triplophysa dalaica]